MPFCTLLGVLTRSAGLFDPGTGKDALVKRPTARVLVADGNASLAGVLAELLADEPGFTVAATATTAAGAVEAARATSPDVLLVDERLDGSLPSEVLPQLRAACPSAVLLLWSHHELHTAASDVDGVLERGMTFRELVREVRAALRRQVVIDLTDGAQPGARTT